MNQLKNPKSGETDETKKKKKIRLINKMNVKMIQIRNKIE